MDMTVINFKFPGISKVHCAFQTRNGGYGQGAYAFGNLSYEVGDDKNIVLQNRKSLLQTLKLDAIAELKQVHGNKMFFDLPPTNIAEKPELEGDGLGTNKKGLALLIKTADCQPILFAHESGDYVGAMHVGWRGNEQDFILSGINDFCQHYNCKPQELFAVRGPSLSPVMAEFINFSKEWNAKFTPWFNSLDKTVNLWALTNKQLEEAGVLQKRIFNIDLCTYTMENDFFSYRQEHKSGRQGNIIWIA